MGYIQAGGLTDQEGPAANIGIDKVRGDTRRARFAYLLVALCLTEGMSLQGIQQYSTKFHVSPGVAQAGVQVEQKAGQLNLPGPDRRLESSQANSDFGNATSSAGDVNGDGYADVVVGAWLYDNGEVDEGAVFLYYGSASGVQTPHAFMADSDRAATYYGYSTAAAGDVNRDGYDDFLVGAPSYSVTTDSMEGRAYLYYGSASGIQEAQTTILQGVPYESLGVSVAGDGDFNGDGFADVVIGANGIPYSLRAYYGSPAGIGTTPSWSANGVQV